jgi:maleylpyruvate isomerase
MQLLIDPRSSSCLRVLCFLAYKGLEIPTRHVRLMQDEHRQSGYLDINPAGALPALVLPDGDTVTQSLVIMALLEAWHPAVPTLPEDARQRAAVMALCGHIVSDMHPLTNLRVRRALGESLPGGQAAVSQWCRTWTESGLQALEVLLARHAGRWCVGDAVTMADFCLAPQMLNAARFGCTLASYPVADRIYRRCLDHPAFAAVVQASA